MDNVPGFSLGKKKNNLNIDIDKIKGGIKTDKLDAQTFSIFKSVIDTDENNILDKNEIDNFILEIKTFAKDNNFSMSETAKYLKSKNLKEVKQEELYNLIEQLVQSSENIEESCVIKDGNGKKTIFIKYKDSTEETIYPDKSKKLEFTGDNNEHIIQNFLPNEEKSSEIILYEDKTKKTITYENNNQITEVIEEGESVTTINYESNVPKCKTVKTGNNFVKYEYINNKELKVYSKYIEYGGTIEEFSKYNDAGQVVNFVKKEDGYKSLETTFEYYETGEKSSEKTIEYNENNQVISEKLLEYFEDGKTAKSKITTIDNDNKKEEITEYDNSGNVLSSEVKENDITTKKENFTYHKNGKLAKSVTYTYESNNFGDKKTTITRIYNSSGMKTSAKEEGSDKYFDGEDFKYTTEIKFNKDGNIVGYVPNKATIESILSGLHIEKNSDLYNKFMKLNRPYFKKYGNTLGFEVGQQFIIPGEIEFDASIYTDVDPKAEIENYNSDNLGNADTSFVATGTKTVEKDMGWWEIAKQNLIELGNSNPTNNQISQQLNLLVTLNGASWNVNDPVKKGSQITVQAKESAGLPDRLKQSSYKLENLKKKYTSDKYKIKQIRTNPETNEWGGDERPIWKYEVIEKASGKTVLVVQDAAQYGEEKPTIKFYDNGKLSREITFEYSDEVIEKVYYGDGGIIVEEQVYDRNGVRKRYTSTNTVTSQRVVTDNPDSPNHTDHHYNGEEYVGSTIHQDGNIAVVSSGSVHGYSSNGSAYEVNEHGEVTYYPEARNFKDYLKKRSVSSVMRAIDSLDKYSYKYFIQAYHNKNKGDLISDIQNSSLDAVTKNYCINKLKNLINIDCKITKPKRTERGYNISLNGDILTIKNAKSGNTHQIQFNSLLKNCNDFEKALLKKVITENLAPEVIEDLAIEVKEINFSSDMSTIPDNPDWKAAGFYNSRNNKITLSVSNIYDWRDNLIEKSSYLNLAEDLTHEIGHSVDFTGYLINTATSSDTNSFIRIFEEELENYEKSGKSQYKYSKDFKRTSTYDSKTGNEDSNTAYATANEKEMLAECYTLFYTGNCAGSKDHILKYFPRTYEAAKVLIKQIRQENESKRHNSFKI